jgi:hypothetical protein
MMNLVENRSLAVFRSGHIYFFICFCSNTLSLKDSRSFYLTRSELCQQLMPWRVFDVELTRKIGERRKNFLNPALQILYKRYLGKRVFFLTLLRPNLSKYLHKSMALQLVGQDLLNSLASLAVNTAKIIALIPSLSYLNSLVTYRWVEQTFFTVPVKCHYESHATIRRACQRLRANFGTRDAFLLRLFRSLHLVKKGVVYKIMYRVVVCFKEILFKNYFLVGPLLILSPFPFLLIRKVRHGREFYPVPHNISLLEREARAVKVFLQAISKRKSSTIFNKLLLEHISIALAQKCNYIQLLDTCYEDIVSSRIYSHFRW